MLQKIVFQDNIYQLARNIELIHNGLILELDESLFAGKILDDIFFCDVLAKKILERLHNQQHLHEYINAMNCLYSCIIKFLTVLTEILEGKMSDSQAVAVNRERLLVTKIESEKLKDQIADEIREKAGHIDNINIVSEMELNQLLNF
ncbi:MAG: hypothetical protein CR988_01080 [Treponema sp.]|nr:MAG: hypothetical protein CR988_01080 [Treponema sp.]